MSRAPRDPNASSTLGFAMEDGNAINPESKIKHALKPDSHIWAELFDGSNVTISKWMDNAFYHSKNKERMDKVRDKANAIAIREKMYWAMIASRKRVNKSLEPNKHCKISYRRCSGRDN